MNLEDYVKFASSNGTKASHITPQPQSTNKMRNEKTTNDRHADVILDTSQLCRIEENTMESQRILSDIFSETDSNEDYKIKVSSGNESIKEFWLAICLPNHIQDVTGKYRVTSDVQTSYDKIYFVQDSRVWQVK